MYPTDDYDPYSPAVIRQLLRDNGLWLSKKRGQNYLVDRNIASKIVSLVPEGLPVLEVGAGLGALTVPLARRGPVTAVEIDAGVCALLEKSFPHPNLTLVHADFLRFDTASLPQPRYAFVSNLPYSVTGEIVRLFIDCEKFETATVMVQKEFLERIEAAPGSEQYGTLAVIAQTFLIVQKRFEAGRKCFFPEPSVDSAVVTLRKRQAPVSQEAFKPFVAACFRSKRKTLANNLKSAGYDPGLLAGTGVEPSTRPEEIPPETWIRLFERFS